jgi:TonB family protein
MVDTSRFDLAVRVRQQDDSVTVPLLTRRLGDAMAALPFRVPPTIDRIFYPGTGGGPVVSIPTRMIARMVLDPPLSEGGPWRGHLDQSTGDSTTDSIFLAAALEAAPRVEQSTDDSVRRPWLAELVLTHAGDGASRHLAQLTDVSIRLEQMAQLVRGPIVNPPSEVRKAGPGGVARVEYVIDERGRPEPNSVRVLTAPSAAFAEWAREMVLATRFKPAMAGGCPQKQRVEQNIRYSSTPPSARSVRP